MQKDITITLPKERYDFLMDNDLLGDHTVKEVIVKDERFKEDPKHKELLKQYIKSKEAIKEYEFKTRHKIA